MSSIDLQQASELLESHTLAESARKLNVSYQNLLGFCKRNDILPRVRAIRGRPSKIAEHKGHIVDMYEKGYSQEQISKKIGVTRQWIRTMLEREGVEIRSMSESAKLRHKSTKSDERKRTAAAANAVRHAMGILNLFN